MIRIVALMDFLLKRPGFFRSKKRFAGKFTRPFERRESAVCPYAFQIARVIRACLPPGKWRQREKQGDDENTLFDHAL